MASALGVFLAPKTWSYYTQTGRKIK